MFAMYGPYTNLETFDKKSPCDRLVSLTDCIRLVAILQRKHLRLGVIGLTLRMVLSQVPDSDVLDY